MIVDFHDKSAPPSFALLHSNLISQKKTADDFVTSIAPQYSSALLFKILLLQICKEELFSISIAPSLHSALLLMNLEVPL